MRGVLGTINKWRFEDEEWKTASLTEREQERSQWRSTSAPPLFSSAPASAADAQATAEAAAAGSIGDEVEYHSFDDLEDQFEECDPFGIDDETGFSG